MTKHLVIFQIGPVQDFINCARKTQDYLAGSLIVSYLTGIAMAKVKTATPKGDIIYPFHVDDRICEEAEKVVQGGSKPNLKGAPLYGTVPNRFVATFTSEMDAIEKVLRAAEEKVRGEYSNILKTAKSALEREIPKLSEDNSWNDLWNRYLSRGVPYLELYWVISPYEDSSYREDYKKAELLLGARKGIRDFVQVEESGIKCTLCGQREQLRSNRDPRLFWQQVRSLDRFKFLFRERERLCALCTAKRLAPEEYFDLKGISFPSTSTMAVSSTLLKLAEKRTDANVAKCIAEFQKSFEAMKLKLFPTKLTPLDLVKDKLGASGPSGIFAYDGDAFIVDTYQPRKIHKEYGSSYREDDPEFSKKVEKAEKSLRQSLKTVDVEEAPKYYAVVSIDGDDMGKWLDGTKTNGKMDLNLHKEISQKLSQYASKDVPNRSEKKYLAKIVYFGGDEGVIFCSLEYLLPMMLDLHNAYSDTFEIGKSRGTNSMGVVIAHHQQNLLQVMAEARDALKDAKRVKVGSDEKNAFCISLMKRSGGTLQIFGKFEMLEHLQKMVRYYQEGKISPRWVYALDPVCPTFQEVDDFRLLQGMIDEIKRILGRHFQELDPSQKKAILNGLIPEIEGIVNTFQVMEVGNVRRNNLKSLMDLEYLGVYIAKGGGR